MRTPGRRCPASRPDAADARFGLGLAFEVLPIGFATLQTHGTTLPPKTFAREVAADLAALPEAA